MMTYVILEIFAIYIILVGISYWVKLEGLDHV